MAIKDHWIKKKCKFSKYWLPIMPCGNYGSAYRYRYIGMNQYFEPIMIRNDNDIKRYEFVYETITYRLNR